MPTASTANILGNSESFEPYISNILTKRVLSGEFCVINRYLINDLQKLELWNMDIINKIMINYGSIQCIDEIPKDVREIYKTAWEISPRIQLEMAVDRAPFLDQSQSLTLYIDHPTPQILNSCHFYSWKKQLKTGMYYLRTKPASYPIPITNLPIKCESCSA